MGREFGSVVMVHQFEHHFVEFFRNDFWQNRNFGIPNFLEWILPVHLKHTPTTIDPLEVTFRKIRLTAVNLFMVHCYFLCVYSQQKLEA